MIIFLYMYKKKLYFYLMENPKKILIFMKRNIEIALYANFLF